MQEFDEEYDRNQDSFRNQEPRQAADAEFSWDAQPIPVQEPAAPPQGEYRFQWQTDENRAEEPLKAPEPQNTVRIDLSGGAKQETGDSIPGVVKNPLYTEHIRNQKKEKSSRRRFAAAMVALSVLNLALFGGAFALGKNYGSQNSRVASKQALIDDMRSSGDSSANGGASETANNGTELSTTAIAKMVGPAVVGITSMVPGQISIFGQTSPSASQGSGIILSADGYIVTNNHVVESATSVTVTLNTGTEYEAKVIGLDEQTDLAVIKIEPQEELTVAKLGDSNEIEVGERVVAIGNPMGLEFFGSVTQGIVSAVNRSVTVDNRTMNLIQTDAAINSGNSGGALINAYGEVIGINSVKVATSGVEGMGFAIPISEVNPVVSDLLEYGYVKGRPVIGITQYRDVTQYMSQAYSWPQGVQVLGVSGESARAAGLQQGDIITSVEGQKITTGEELNKIKDQHKPGDVLKMEVYKYATGQTVTIEVTLSEQIPG